MSTSTKRASAEANSNPRVTTDLAPASLWGDIDLTIIRGSSPSDSNVFAYVFTAQGTQHVNYCATPVQAAGAHIYELWFSIDQGWQYGDLTAATGAPLATGSPKGYMFDAQGTQHVNYRGTDNHIYELWWDGAWHYGDLTAATGAPLAAGDPRGYMFDSQGTQHVNYRGADNHIYELWWDGGWHYGDLTAATGAPLAAGDPFGYVFASQGTQHVIYMGADQHIHELWWDANGWHYGDLTLATNATLAYYSNPAGYVFAAQNTQHIHYRGVDSHIHELLWDSAGWHHNDLSGLTDAQNALTDPYGYVYNSQATQHVNYCGVDRHIYELLWDSGNWTCNDLTVTIGVSINAGGNPSGCDFPLLGTQHVFYRALDGHVHEMVSPDAQGTGPLQ